MTRTPDAKRQAAYRARNREIIQARQKARNHANAVLAKRYLVEWHQLYRAALSRFLP